MITRRSFIAALLAAPAIVRSTSLMPLYVPPSMILYADGVHDDTRALQAWIDGDRRVVWQDGRHVGDVIADQRFMIGSDGVPLYIRGNQRKLITCCHFRFGRAQ